MQAGIADKKEMTNAPIAGADTVIYEVGYHLLPTLEETSFEESVSKFRDTVNKAGGAFIAEGAPQKISLAYPMAVWNNGVWVKYPEAFFGWLKFEINPSDISSIEQAFKEDKAVIRFLIVKTVKEDTRAAVRQFVLKEIKRGDSIKSTIKRAPAAESKEEKVSDQKLDEMIEEMTAD